MVYNSFANILQIKIDFKLQSLLFENVGFLFLVYIFQNKINGWQCKKKMYFYFYFAMLFTLLFIEFMLNKTKKIYTEIKSRLQ